MPQAQTGHRTAGSTPVYLKSAPKICRINGDDNLKVVYRNLGNNHAYPFIWGDSFTVASGVKVMTIASGIKFHGFDLVTYGNVVVTPCYDAGDFYIEKSSGTDSIIYHAEKNPSNAGTDTIDVQFMLGVDPAIETIYCRGNRGASPSLP